MPTSSLCPSHLIQFIAQLRTQWAAPGRPNAPMPLPPHTPTPPRPICGTHSHTPALPHFA